MTCEVKQPGSGERTPWWRCRSSFALALLLFLLAMLPRVSGIDTAPMQTDEVHWNIRAELLHQRLKKLSRQFSTHLGHPGVFPAFVLMSGQVAANKYNKAAEALTGTPGSASSLKGARLGNALFSSFLPCIVFLFLLNWTGRGEAFCTGALLALGPRMIDLSQLAHIDTIFSVVVTLTVLSYLTALRAQRVGLKLIAGALFGLCLLCKPTCLALIPAFMAAKAILRWRWPETFKEGPIAWSDVWVVFTAMLVFVASYTRMWHHHKPYPQWEGLDRTVPEYLYSVGRSLGDGTPRLLLVAALVLVGIHFLRKLRARASLNWIDQSLAVVSATTLFMIAMPQAFENLTLYFMRVFALTSVKHVSFRGVATPIPGGYLTLASVDLPPLVLISIFLMPLLFIPKVRRTLSASEQQVWVMASIVSVVWLLFLSTSSKQAWRYALPVAPQLYIIACLSLCAVGRFIKAPRLPLVLLLLGQVKAVYRGYPHWDLYQSPFAPPAQVAAQLGVFHPRTGQLEAIRYLILEAQTRGRDVNVTVFGDGKLLSREADRWFGREARRVHFGYYREGSADFMLVQGQSQIGDSVFEKYLSNEPVMVSRVKGVPVATLYSTVRHANSSTVSARASHQLTNLDTSSVPEQEDSD